jgi:hypothetical protein
LFHHVTAPCSQGLTFPGDVRPAVVRELKAYTKFRGFLAVPYFLLHYFATFLL